MRGLGLGLGLSIKKSGAVTPPGPVVTSKFSLIGTGFKLLIATSLKIKIGN